MKLNELKPACGAKHKRKRRGCGTGSGHGGTSTRGHKGLRARAGGTVPAWFEGGQMPLQRRIPGRGFTNFTRTAYQVVNVAALARFEAGQTVGVDELVTARLVGHKSRPVKLLANGELPHALTIRVHAASKSAIEKVKRSGGVVELLWPAEPEPPRDKRGKLGKRSRRRQAKPVKEREEGRDAQQAGKSEA